jgi:uncharacterized 2Fe-2S/4Fe-4S cluster protein (DUF4445 family)
VFTGSDLISAVTAISLQSAQSTTPLEFLLADIGTNCEMAYYSASQNEKLICAASAAGPAFEGAGICGSVLVSDVACLLDAGMLDESGLLCDGEITLHGDIVLTQADIRNFQLAKGALRAGLEVVLEESQFDGGEIPLYVCGAFGSALNPKDAARLGLFPAESVGRVIPAGNAALDGAALMLFSEEARSHAEHLAHIAKSINLAEHPRFQNEFIGALNFPAPLNSY